MHNILRENYAEQLTDPILELLLQQNTLVIETISKRIGSIGKLKSSDLHKLKSGIEYAGIDLKKLEKELEILNRKTISEINRIFDVAAKENSDFAKKYYKSKGIPMLPYAKNVALLKIVDSIRRKTINDFINISRTKSFLIDGKVLSIRKQYLKVVDSAIFNVTTGTLEYNTAMRMSIKKMADSGVRNVDFASGYSRRIDSQMRMNILDGVRQMNMDMQQQMGKEYGADGVEISVHALCAPDHQSIQGKQYSITGTVIVDGVKYEDYNKINLSLKRHIGTMNCKHFAFPIILGISNPVYTKKEIEDMNKNSNQKVMYGNKEMSKYEATQEQRKQETMLRYLKDERNAFKTAGNEEESKRINRKIMELNKDYKKNSEFAGLSPKMIRTRVVN